MLVLNGSPLRRHGPVFDLPREDGGHAEPGARSGRGEEAQSRNDLTPTDALKLVRAIRAGALRQHLPDSTPLIRADRDGP